MPYIEFSPTSVVGRGLSIEVVDRDITFRVDQCDDETEEVGHQVELTFPAFRRHIDLLAAAFERLANIHAERKRGNLPKPLNKFWVGALKEESTTSNPFRGVSVEHDNRLMYVMASFVKEVDPDDDHYERIRFSLDIEVSRQIALVLRDLAKDAAR
ncbi:hypothetical protein ACU8MW_08535 [Rhizobium leguminosarum]